LEKNEKFETNKRIFFERNVNIGPSSYFVHETDAAIKTKVINTIVKFRISNLIFTNLHKILKL